jgi:hypothetical protein
MRATTPEDDVADGVPAETRPETGSASSRERGTPGGDKEVVMAAGEAPIRQAVKWIDDRLADDPTLDRVKLVDEASRRFDLTPLDTDFLFRHLAERKAKTT